MAVAGVFINGGWHAFSEPGPRPDHVAALGLPEPELLVKFNGAAMVVGGAAFAVGVLPRAAATGLVASMSATTVAGHGFWREHDPDRRKQQLGHFLKNLGILGGLLIYLSLPRES